MYAVCTPCAHHSLFAHTSCPYPLEIANLHHKLIGIPSKAHTQQTHFDKTTAFIPKLYTKLFFFFLIVIDNVVRSIHINTDFIALPYNKVRFWFTENRHQWVPQARRKTTIKVPFLNLHYLIIQIIRHGQPKPCLLVTKATYQEARTESAVCYLLWFTRASKSVRKAWVISLSLFACAHSAVIF